MKARHISTYEDYLSQLLAMDVDNERLGCNQTFSQNEDISNNDRNNSPTEHMHATAHALAHVHAHAHAHAMGMLASLLLIIS